VIVELSLRVLDIKSELFEKVKLLRVFFERERIMELGPLLLDIP